MAELLPIDNVSPIISKLQQGALMAFPTDTVWGIGCSSEINETVLRLYPLKNRPINQPTALLISNPTDLELYCETISKHLHNIVARFWPGALTIILKVKRIYWDRPFCSKEGTIGFRIPDYAPLRFIIQSLGSPLVASSANERGEQPLQSSDEIMQQFNDKIDAVVTSDVSFSGQKASTVLDASVSPCTIVREGAISRFDLEQFL